MKQSIKLFIIIGIILVALAINGCDPFDDVYLTLAMKTNFDIEIVDGTFSVTQDTCLSEFDDYDKNKNNIEEIIYISSAYITMDSTNGFEADSLILTVLRGDNSTQLFSFTIHNFNADEYVNNPLEIKITQQEVDNINSYLSNPQEDKCFIAKLECFNATPPNAIYRLNSVIDILTQLKIKP